MGGLSLRQAWESRHESSGIFTLKSWASGQGGSNTYLTDKKEILREKQYWRKTFQKARKEQTEAWRYQYWGTQFAWELQFTRRQRMTRNGANLGLSYTKKGILEVPWISTHFIEYIIEWVWKCFNIDKTLIVNAIPDGQHTDTHTHNCDLLVVLAGCCYSWELFNLCISPCFFWVNFRNVLCFS